MSFDLIEDKMRREVNSKELSLNFLKSLENIHC